MNGKTGVTTLHPGAATATGDVIIKNVPVGAYIPTNTAQQSFLSVTLSATAAATSADAALAAVDSEAKTVFSVTCASPPKWKATDITSLSAAYKFPAYSKLAYVRIPKDSVVSTDPYCPFLGHDLAGPNKDDFTMTDEGSNLLVKFSPKAGAVGSTYKMQVEANYGGDTKLLTFNTATSISFTSSCDATNSADFKEVVLYEIPDKSTIVPVLNEAQLKANLLTKPAGCEFVGSLRILIDYGPITNPWTLQYDSNNNKIYSLDLYSEAYTHRVSIQGTI